MRLSIAIFLIAIQVKHCMAAEQSLVENSFENTTRKNQTFWNLKPVPDSIEWAIKATSQIDFRRIYERTIDGRNRKRSRQKQMSKRKQKDSDFKITSPDISQDKYKTRHPFLYSTEFPKASFCLISS